MDANSGEANINSQASEAIWSVGLMTGTVLDGYVDVALLKTDGQQIVEFGPFSLEPYDKGVVELLRETLRAAQAWQFDGPEPAIFSKAEKLITEQQSKAVLDVVQRAGIAVADIGVVGFHGQSVLHRASQPGKPGRTRQLGDGQRMSEILGIPVAWDFRSTDVARGGQGAPLAPVYHQALLQHSATHEKLGNHTAVLNLGGVANLTWWDGEAELIAFDTGPANAPVNDWIAQSTSDVMDIDGKHAAAGTVDEQRLAELLEHPYLSAAFPKSLDRFDFASSMADGLNLQDGAALLTAFSATAVSKGLDLLPNRPDTVVLCGGGRHNPSLVKSIQQRAAVNTIDADELAWRGDAIEAECFAYLAVRVLRNLPLSFPSTTGVSAPCCGGKLSNLNHRNS
ncbi:MAG: anhydro-N-acetylmuramic acid kinase [Granulosicoccus sp.]